MDVISLIQHDVAFVHFLISLDERHPNPHGSVLIYGPHTDADSYVRIAIGLGFKVYVTESSATFAEHIQSNPHVQFIVAISDRIDQKIRDALISACESLDPLYALHITRQSGAVPGTDKRYQFTIHDHNISSGNQSGDRVARATRDLFCQANIADITDRSVPAWIEQELARRDRS